MHGIFCVFLEVGRVLYPTGGDPTRCCVAWGYRSGLRSVGELFAACLLSEVVALVTIYHPEATFSLRLNPGQDIRPFHALSVSCVEIFTRRSFTVP